MAHGEKSAISATTDILRKSNLIVAKALELGPQHWTNGPVSISSRNGRIGLGNSSLLSVVNHKPYSLSSRFAVDIINRSNDPTHDTLDPHC